MPSRKKLTQLATSTAILWLWLACVATYAQTIDGSVLSKPWEAVWITGPGEPMNIWSGTVPEDLKRHMVLKFRKSFELASKPSTYVVHVSADNRYKLFVNGNLISLGPARGDLFHWNFETVDLAPYLNVGKNTLAAVVWNEGPMKPEAQVSLMTAFILQGNTDAEKAVNTNDTWRVILDEGYRLLRPRTMGYYVAGQGEWVDMNRAVLGWEANAYDDTAWQKPRTMHNGVPKGVFTFAPVTWMLTPSMIPQMERSIQRMGSVRRVQGIKVPSGYPKVKAPLVVPPKTTATLLIDNDVLTNAYPTLVFSGGKNAGISIGFAEALYIRKNNEDLSRYTIQHMPKGNRNEVEGKVFVGRRDSIVSNGATGQQFTTLWYRTYRYVELKVTTAESALTIDDIYGVFTGYPFQMVASLQSTDPMFQKNLEIGWRTARLCATETYMDCPYYEQLQYFGDTRIQALVTLFNSSDDRLVRSAIVQGDRSRLAEGVTMSRYPTASTQIIPPFSLWWIGMVHDYWMYRDDEEFVRQRLAGTRQVLSFFSSFQKQGGSLQGLPYWIFTDWVDSPGWKDGVAPLSANGQSSILDIQLAWTYDLAAELESSVGLQQLANVYRERADILRNTVRQKYWDAAKGLFADTPEHDVYSQHAQALAILSGMVKGDAARELAGKMLNEASLAQASIYFKYYVHLAAVRAGLGNDYLKWLGKWNENIAMGLTTWAEMSDVDGSRSDCHAWGSSPNVEFYRVVLGIDSEKPGFGRVKIEPHLGTLNNIRGTMPHPNGSISVSYAKDKKGSWVVTAELPQETSGTFVWQGKTHELRPGVNNFTF